jgi:hypothetical protein
MEKNKYEVLVGNIGTVHSGYDHLAAYTEYQSYVQLSESESGRAAGEDVIMLQDGEPTHVFEGRMKRTEGTLMDDRNSAPGAFIIHLSISDGHVERIGRHLVEGCASEKAALVAAFAREAVDVKVVITDTNECDDGGCYRYRMMKAIPVLDDDLEVLRKYF